MHVWCFHIVCLSVQGLELDENVCVCLFVLRQIQSYYLFKDKQSLVYRYQNSVLYAVPISVSGNLDEH